MFYKQHLMALDSFLNAVEYKIDRDVYDDLADTSGAILDCLANASKTYQRGWIGLSAKWLEEAADTIDDFAAFAVQFQKPEESTQTP